MQVLASFITQLKSPLILILLAASVVSIILGRVTDGGVILVVVAINSIFGAFWEVRAAKAVESLKKYIAPKAKIIVQGIEKEIDAAQLKSGDLVLVEAGDRVPADGVLTEANLIQIDESALSGESIPVEKKVNGKVYAGTLVLVGSGVFRVAAAGDTTEIAKIAKVVAESPEVESPLQKRIAALGRFLAVTLLAVSFATFLTGLILNYDASLMFTLGVALAVSSVPEGLPIAVTVVLAVGLVKMAKRKAIVRKLAAVEALGSVTIIVTDKTGTLTKGEIAAEKVYLHQEKKLEDVATLKNSQALARLLIVGVLCNNARILADGEIKIIGDPAEAALLILAEKAKVDWRKIRSQFKRVGEFPFDPKLRYMATLNQVPKNNDKFAGQQVLFVKGAPPDVINLCDSELDQEEILRITEKMARQGLRVLAFAFAEIGKAWVGIEKEKFSGKLKFLGLVGFADQVREEAWQTVEKLKAAGVQVLMVTGDHELTAIQVAKNSGILAEKQAIAWGFTKSKDIILASLEKYSVLARVPPAAKSEIVKKLQTNGEIVAMTGDGVNDAPALVAADVGVALGAHGTDVAKEAADIVLTDDNLSTIYSALVEGRVIFENIKKIVVYLLSDSFGAIILTIGAIFLGAPLPLLPTQILWINLVTDSLPDIALAFEPAEAKVLTEKPAKNSQILNFDLKFLVLAIGAASGLVTLFLFVATFSLTSNLEYARTLTFATLGANTLVYVFSVRSFRQNLWQTNFLSNKFLLVSIFAGFAVLILGIYFKPLASIFETIFLKPADWLIVAAACLFVVFVVEVAKSFFILKQKWPKF